MIASRVAPTRINLLRLERQLAQVNRGSTLLRRKREALVSELFRAARPAVDARSTIAARLQVAYDSLLGALASHGAAELRETAWPGAEILVDITPAQVWGIPVSDVVPVSPLRRSADARQADPALAGPAAVITAERFEEAAELLLRAVSLEQRLRRLGDGVSRTTRQLRVLEERLAPGLRAHLRFIDRTLEEREREEHIRLRHLRGRINPRNSSTIS